MNIRLLGYHICSWGNLIKQYNYSIIKSGRIQITPYNILIRVKIDKINHKLRPIKIKGYSKMLYKYTIRISKLNLIWSMHIKRKV